MKKNRTAPIFELQTDLIFLMLTSYLLRSLSCSCQRRLEPATLLVCWFSYFLDSIYSGINTACPAPRHKANLTVCNHGTQVCVSGVF